MPLFLYQVKLRLAHNAMLEGVPEEEKVFVAVGYLRGRAFACFKKYLEDFLFSEEGHRKKDTEELFSNFQGFKDRLRLIFGFQKKLHSNRRNRNTRLSVDTRWY